MPQFLPLVDHREEINKNILSSRSETVKRQLRATYAEKDREVKRRIKADKRKWVQNISDEVEEAAKSYMTPGRLSPQSEFTPVPSRGSIFVYMIPP